MKTIMKKIVLACLVTAFAASAFGCNKSNKDLQIETISLDQTKFDLTFYYDNTPGDPADNAEDATEAAQQGGEDGEEPVYEDVTDFVDVTDAEGQPVTDDAGVVQTEAVVVETRVVSGGSGNGNGSGNGSGNSGGDGNTQTPAQNYTPSYDTCKAYWMDMSQAGDYFFEGEFLIITFEIKEDAPDGSYPIKITTTDFASWEEVSYTPSTIDGEIAVNTDVASQANAGNDFTLKVNSTSAKQGDLATVVIDLSNNPGFCTFIVDVQYDKNAMTIMDAGAGGDFGKNVSSVQ